MGLNTRTIKQMLLIVAASVLVGCGGGGGGGDDSSSDTSSQGFWAGTSTSGSTQSQVSFVILDDGTYYGVFQNEAGLGLFQGNGSTKNGQFTSNNGIQVADYSDPAEFSLSSTVVAKTSLKGTVTYKAPASGTANVDFTYDASYETAVPLATLAGAYQAGLVTASSQGPATLTLQSNGSYTATETNTGCVVSGTLKPRGTTAVFDLTVVYDQATCGESLTVKGIATTPQSGLVLFFAVRSDRSDFLFGGATKNPDE